MPQDRLKDSSKNGSTNVLPIISIIIAVAALLVAVFRPAAIMPETGTADSQAGSTRIESGAEPGIIRFYIDDREMMRLDGAGLHVRGNIDYGGMITDYGAAGFDDRAGWKEYERRQRESGDAP